MLTIPDIETTLQALAGERPIFHSEADFQHALAWSLRERFDDVGVRLEFPLPWEDGRAYADIWLRTPDGPVALELKYWKRGVRVTVEGEEFALPNQAAQDLHRYDSLKDLTRVERLVGSGLARSGVVIAVTNDQGYWRPPRPGRVDADFRLHDGRGLAGTLRWADHAGAGTTRGREAPLTLQREYGVAWRPYSTVGTGPGTEFRYLFLGVG